MLRGAHQPLEAAPTAGAAIKGPTATPYMASAVIGGS